MSNIYIFSDESGVFDIKNNNFYIFAGVILLGNDEKEKTIRKFIHAEKCLKEKSKYKKYDELKAYHLKPGDKNKLFRSLNNVKKFATIIDIKRVNRNIFADKKSKQRYLDYAYKIAVKNALQNLINKGEISPSKVDNIYFFVDEHTTATNGRYELREALEGELKRGTYNGNYRRYFPPLFKDIKAITLEYCDSEKKPLVRAADIIANKLFYLANNYNNYELNKKLDILNNIKITRLP